MPSVAEPQIAPTETESTSAFTETEARQLFDLTARRYLGISGEEFLRTWDAKAMQEAFHTPELRARVDRVAALIPLVRSICARKKTR